MYTHYIHAYMDLPTVQHVYRIPLNQTSQVWCLMLQSWKLQLYLLVYLFRALQGTPLGSALSSSNCSTTSRCLEPYLDWRVFDVMKKLVQHVSSVNNHRKYKVDNVVQQCWTVEYISFQAPGCLPPAHIGQFLWQCLWWFMTNQTSTQIHIVRVTFLD